MLTRDLQRSNDNLAVHGKIIIHLSTNLSTPLSNPGPSQTSGLADSLRDMNINASTTSLTPSPSMTGAASSTIAVSASATAASVATEGATPDLSRQNSSRVNATSSGGHMTNPAPGIPDRNFSATEDQYGPLPTGWERRTDHLGRTYYVCILTPST
jgi:E3 ubiquitin-protein ligase NEDD4